MKKLLFTAYTLDVGGIETALINLLNNLIQKYDVTLVLEKKEGLFLEELNKNIKIIEYSPSLNSNVFKRKAINLFKRIKFIYKYKNKFDFAASFTTYSKAGSFCARIASKNNALWIHSDYLKVYENDKKRMYKFFKFINFKKFSKFIFVSDSSKKSFQSVFNLSNKQLIKINNLIDYKTIINKSKENIELLKDNNKTTFLNVSRHDEPAKKITRLIEAAKILKSENYNFIIFLIGSGKDTSLYKNLVNKYNLNDTVLFLGKKKNPYPYFKISDAMILTSDYEGYPVVFVESYVLELPIITTNVSDSIKDIDGKFGIVTSNEISNICDAMKKIIKKEFKFNTKFNVEEFNNNILNKLEQLF